MANGCSNMVILLWSASNTNVSLLLTAKFAKVDIQYNINNIELEKSTVKVAELDL